MDVHIGCFDIMAKIKQFSYIFQCKIRLTYDNLMFWAVKNMILQLYYYVYNLSLSINKINDIYIWLMCV